jgi:hypothetical protein
VVICRRALRRCGVRDGTGGTTATPAEEGAAAADGARAAAAEGVSRRSYTPRKPAFVASTTICPLLLMASARNRVTQCRWGSGCSGP